MLSGCCYNIKTYFFIQVHYSYTKIRSPRISPSARYITLLQKITRLHNIRAIEKVSENILRCLQVHTLHICSYELLDMRVPKKGLEFLPLILP